MSARRPISFDKLKRCHDAAVAILASTLANDPLELDAAALESACDRIARRAGAALVVSDLRALAAEFEAVAAAEARGRERAAWMAARGVQEGGK